jgi:hypothetical protein
MTTIRFECPHCSHPMLDGARTKGEWNRTGQYRRVKSEIRNPKSELLAEGHHPKSEIRIEEATVDRKWDSFHWEAVIDFPWDELVQLWLDACNAERRGNLKPKIQFYQKRRAMFKDEESLLKGGLHFRRSVYEINSDWPEERGRFLTGDRQEEDMFWVTARAWSDEKSRKLWFGKVFGFAAIEELRIKYKVQPNCTFVDSNFLPKGDNGVYAACLKYGWVAVRGDQKYSFTHRLPATSTRPARFIQKSYAPLQWGDPHAGTGSQGRKYAPLITFSKPQLNSKVQELIDNGRWEEPMDSADPEMEKEYSQQMAARVKKTDFDKRTGETRVYWKESKNDHARDLANMQVLGAILRDLLPDPAMEVLSQKEQGELQTKETLNLEPSNLEP